jgi:NADH oxidase (H2O2-forming)
MRVVVVGGGVAGVAAASEAHSLGAEVTLLERSESYIPPKSSWPSLLSGEAQPSPSERPDYEVREFSRMGSVVDEVDVAERTAMTSKGPVEYDSIVIATGSTHADPTFRGSAKKNVFIMRGYPDYLRLAKEVRGFTRVCVTGGGPLSLSIAEKVSSLGAIVLLLSPTGLLAHLSEAIRREVERRAKEAGLVLLRSPLDGVAGVERVEAVVASGSVHASEALIFLPEPRPNPPRLAVGVGMSGGILVDDRMCSSSPVVYAAGDCAEVRLGSTSFSSPMMYQSAARAMGRVAGANAAGGSAVTRLASAVSHTFFGYEVCYGGLSPAEGTRLGMRLLEASTPPRGDGFFCSLFFDGASTEIRGIQVAGRGASSYEDAISLIISNGMTIPNLAYQESSFGQLSPTNLSPIALAAKTGLLMRKQS